jgi:DNA repair exonuclease SbcCD ATPase subunit
MRMKLVLKTLHLKNFKGVKDRTVKFDGNTRVLGENAAGKSTLADSWYWLWADCNTALVKNPPVTPIGMEECVSRVEAELEIDGKPLSIAKNQKYKSKEVDGKITTSVTNTYEINSVEKSYKDFVSDLIERWIPMDSFLIFSHPAAFTADTSKQGREKQRALLFKMCEGITDSDIAEKMDGIDELKELFDTYKLEEIEQMQKSTLKKIKDTVGVDNAIINARIEEVISQKSTLDAKVLEEQKANYEAEIERIDNELSGDMTDKIQHISEIRMQREKMRNKAQQTLNEKKSELDRKLREAALRKDDNRQAIAIQDNEIVRLETIIKAEKEDLEKQRKLYKAEQDSVMDDDLSVCPVCKREFDAEKLSEIKAEFEENKAKRLKLIKSTGDKLKAEIKDNEVELKAHQTTKAELEKTTEVYQKIVDDMRKKIDALPETADMSSNKVYQRLCKEIEEFDSNVKDQSHIKELKSQRNVNQQMLNQVVAELGSLDRNKELDEHVKELREERKQAEIKRANAEKILDEVERFKKVKNDCLSEEINKHFKVAQFRLFKTLKNGSIEDACDVLIDGKEINSQVNQASQIRAKLDIIRGLSDYFETWMPVFIDDFSLFTSKTEKEIVMDNQLIKLCATDGVKELKVERG